MEEKSSTSTFRRNRVIPCVLFLFLMIIGLCIYDDYGISVDEEVQRLHGIVTYRWINRNFLHRKVEFTPNVMASNESDDLPNYENRFYGVALQLPLVLAEDLYRQFTGRLMPYGTIFHMRHLFTYFMFLFSLVCFYRMLEDLFDSSILSLTGVLMVCIFGRLFAHSFFNIKDGIFTSMIMITLFCAERLFKTQYSTKWSLLLAVVSALTVSSRMVGALIPLIVVLLSGMDSVLSRSPIKWKPLLLICLAFPIWLLISPASWTDPVKYCQGSIHVFSDYTTYSYIEYFAGEYWQSTEMPRRFFLQWIAISAPLVVLIPAAAGMLIFPIQLFTKRGTADEKWKKYSFVLMFLLFWITILYQVIRQPTVYTDWRHIFFLYPPMVCFALYAVTWLWERFPTSPVRLGITCFLVLGIAYNIFLTVKNHPYEYTAMNPIGQQFPLQYETDYWKLSPFSQMKWMLAQHPDRKLTFNYRKLSLQFYEDLMLLPPEDRDRIEYSMDDPDYVLVWSRFPVEYMNYEEEGYTKVHPIIAYGAEVCSLLVRNDLLEEIN